MTTHVESDRILDAVRHFTVDGISELVTRYPASTPGKGAKKEVRHIGSPCWAVEYIHRDDMWSFRVGRRIVSDRGDLKTDMTLSMGSQAFSVDAVGYYSGALLFRLGGGARDMTVKVDLE